MNKICINGRLIKDPEFKKLENDNSLCTFFIANNAYSGTGQKTGFYKCSAFGRTGQTIADFAKRGTELFITGRLDQYRYEDKTGKINYSTSIIVDHFDFGSRPKSKSQDLDQQVA